MAIYLDSLIVEVTRKCNLECEHCLRGEPQDKNAALSALDLLLDEIDHIGTIVLTGGEPLLDPFSLSDILLQLKAHDIGINSFYLATNGTVCSDETLLLLVEWWLYMRACSGEFEPEDLACVEWSNDSYHTDFTDAEALAKLKALAFARPKYSSEFRIRDEYVIPEGRAQTWGQGRLPSIYPVEIEEYDDIDYHIMGDLYLNCDGMLINGCDWSYETQASNSDVRIIHVPTWKSETGKDRYKSLVQVLQEYNGRITRQ